VPSSTFLVGVAVFLVLLALDRWRRQAALRRRTERGQSPRGGSAQDWLATRLVLETDADTARTVVTTVAKATMSRPEGADRWALLTEFDRYDATVRLDTRHPGAVVLAPLSAPDHDGAPDGSAWLDFRDRVAKAARKAGVPCRTEPSPAFVASARPAGKKSWVPRG
jgi:hypothetical protein